MRALISRFVCLHARWLPLLALGCFAGVAWAQAEDDVPVLRQGLWEFQRIAGAKKFAATECIDPSEDLRRQHIALQKMGCTLAPTVRNGSSYTYAAECSVKLPSGAVSFSTVSVLTAESGDAYRLDNRLTNQAGTKDESITAQRVADCAR